MDESRLSGVISLIRVPSRRISPSETDSNPAIMRSVIVFPQPDGPKSVTNSPLSIFTLIWSTARNVPDPSCVTYSFVKFFNLILACFAITFLLHLPFLYYGSRNVREEAGFPQWPHIQSKSISLKRRTPHRTGYLPPDPE